MHHKPNSTGRFEVDKPLAAGIVLVLLGIAQFAACTIFAIRIYDGGSRLTQGQACASQGYDLTRNFFSDLGRTKDFDGNDNTTCARCFNTSLLILGVVVVIFFVLSLRACEEI